MNTVLLASILAFPAAALADAPASAPAPSVAPANAAAGADVDQQALELLRAIRAASASGDKDVAPLRAELDALRSGADDEKAVRRLARAADFLGLIDAGEPLPPLAPEERGGAGGGSASPGDGSAAAAPAGGAAAADEAARAREAAASARAQARAAALLGGLSGAEADAGSLADASFDGAVARPAAPVEAVPQPAAEADPEPEPAPGYHTVDADDFLSQTDDAGRLSVLTAHMSALLSKAGLPDKGGKLAASLGSTIAADIEADPVFGKMEALRVRERPDGELSIVYRVSGAGVVEEDLGLTLASDDGGGAVASAKKRHGHGHGHKRRKGQSAAADDDDSGGDDGSGGDGGGAAARGGGRDGADFAAGRGGADLNRGDRGDRGAADDGARAAPSETRARGVARREPVDPDGGSTQGRGRAGSSAVAARASRTSLPGGFTASEGPRGGESPAGRAGAGSSARRASRASGADEEAEIPSLPHLNGDLAGGRGGRPAGAPPARSGAGAALASSARPAAPAPAAAAGAFASPPSAQAQASAYDASDGPLSDAVAGSPTVPVPSAAPLAAPTAPPSRSASVPAALLLASAGLGVGVFMRRSKR